VIIRSFSGIRIEVTEVCPSISSLLRGESHGRVDAPRRQEDRREHPSE
jgi:hypothetical protein